MRWVFYGLFRGLFEQRVWLFWWGVALLGCKVESSAPLRIVGFEGGVTLWPTMGPIVVECAPSCPAQSAIKVYWEGERGAPLEFKWQLQNQNLLVGTPDNALLPDERYRLEFAASLGSAPLPFKTALYASDLAPKLTLWPAPSEAVPTNLSWLIVKSDPPLLPSGVKAIALKRGEIKVEGRGVWLSGVLGAPERVQQAIVWGPFRDEACSSGVVSQLCPETEYQIVSEPGLRLTDSSKSVVQTLATFKTTATALEAFYWTEPGALQVSDTALHLRRRASAPCQLQDVQTKALHDFTDFEWQMEGLTPATPYQWELQCIDSAGHASQQWRVSVTTLPRIDVVIGEVVVEPRQDWGDSVANGEPFDNQPGNGAISASDEWVELYNQGESVVDISSWKIEVVDRDQSSVTLKALASASPKQLYTRSGSLLLAPGEYAVVRLSPDSKNASSTAKIRLIDAMELLRDEVVLGSSVNGRTIPSGRSTGADDEAVIRCKSGWFRAQATPGAANRCPAS